MNETTILHVMILDKFLPPFIDFIDEHFGRENHHYVFITSEKYEYGLTKEHNVEFLHTDDDIFITLLECMIQAKKIILHGLWRDKIDLLLYSNQTLLKKCYWVMWGGDFYFPETKSNIRKYIVQNIHYCITQVEDDYIYIKEHYGALGERVDCFVYPSNLYKPFHGSTKRRDRTINIQIGNSASETNKHFEVFEKLSVYKKNKIKIFVPLSYGDNEYAEAVIAKGKELFKEKFVPIREFMPLSDYSLFLSKIDIAIFANNRQQGMGNLTMLLGMGKKIYLKKNISPWKMFETYHLNVFDIDDFNLDLIEEAIGLHNISIMKEHFSEKRLKEQFLNLFERVDV